MKLKPTLPKRILIETDGRTLEMIEKDNGVFHLTEGLDGDYRVIALSKSELQLAYSVMVLDSII